MRFGVVILPEHAGPRTRELWRRAEEFGFHSAWTYDHLMWRWLRDDPWYGSVPTLAFAAAATSRIALGTLVAGPDFRHPVTFAKEVMTLDQLSEGRLICGLGSGAGGYDAEVLGGTGPRPKDRAARFAEFVELSDSLLRQPATSYAGAYYTARDVTMRPGCVQRPRVPFAIAATGPRAMRVAARHADTWITAGTPGQFDALAYRDAVPVLKQQSAAFDEACAEAGRDPGSVKRLLVTGAMVGGVLDSVEAFRDAAGTFAELGFTDLVVHWPRPSFPYQGRLDTLEKIAAEVLIPAMTVTTRGNRA
jgi:alkanesulfonate monooxygenase SsuD/methylene tetrahydromethanopterin reductase-like flavin-dependent oxidoreductase (luciferase family)